MRYQLQLLTKSIEPPIMNERSKDKYQFQLLTINGQHQL